MDFSDFLMDDFGDEERTPAFDSFFDGNSMLEQRKPREIKFIEKAVIHHHKISDRSIESIMKISPVPLGDFCKGYYYFCFGDEEKGFKDMETALGKLGITDSKFFIYQQLLLGCKLELEQFFVNYESIGEVGTVKDLKRLLEFLNTKVTIDRVRLKCLKLMIKWMFTLLKNNSDYEVLRIIGPIYHQSIRKIYDRSSFGLILDDFETLRCVVQISSFLFDYVGVRTFYMYSVPQDHISEILEKGEGDFLTPEEDEIFKTSISLLTIMRLYEEHQKKEENNNTSGPESIGQGVIDFENPNFSNYEDSFGLLKVIISDDKIRRRRRRRRKEEEELINNNINKCGHFVDAESGQFFYTNNINDDDDYEKKYICFIPKRFRFRIKNIGEYAICNDLFRNQDFMLFHRGSPVCIFPYENTVKFLGKDYVLFFEDDEIIGKNNNNKEEEEEEEEEGKNKWFSSSSRTSKRRDRRLSKDIKVINGVVYKDGFLENTFIVDSEASVSLLKYKNGPSIPNKLDESFLVVNEKLMFWRDVDLRKKPIGSVQQQWNYNNYQTSAPIINARRGIWSGYTISLYEKYSRYKLSRNNFIRGINGDLDFQQKVILVLYSIERYDLMDCFAKSIRNEKEGIYFYDTITFPNIQLHQFSKMYQQMVINLHFMNRCRGSRFSKIPLDVLKHQIIPYISEIDLLFAFHPEILNIVMNKELSSTSRGTIYLLSSTELDRVCTVLRESEENNMLFTDPWAIHEAMIFVINILDIKNMEEIFLKLGITIKRKQKNENIIMVVDLGNSLIKLFQNILKNNNDDDDDDEDKSLEEQIEEYNYCYKRIVFKNVLKTEVFHFIQEIQEFIKSMRNQKQEEKKRDKMYYDDEFDEEEEDEMRNINNVFLFPQSCSFYYYLDLQPLYGSFDFFILQSSFFEDIDEEKKKDNLKKVLKTLVSTIPITTKKGVNIGEDVKQFVYYDSQLIEFLVKILIGRRTRRTRRKSIINNNRLWKSFISEDETLIHQICDLLIHYITSHCNSMFVEHYFFKDTQQQNKNKKEEEEEEGEEEEEEEKKTKLFTPIELRMILFVLNDIFRLSIQDEVVLSRSFGKDNILTKIQMLISYLLTLPIKSRDKNNQKNVMSSSSSEKFLEFIFSTFINNITFKDDTIPSSIGRENYKYNFYGRCPPILLPFCKPRTLDDILFSGRFLHHIIVSIPDHYLNNNQEFRKSLFYGISTFLDSYKNSNFSHDLGPLLFYIIPSIQHFFVRISSSSQNHHVVQIPSCVLPLEERWKFIDCHTPISLVVDDDVLDNISDQQNCDFFFFVQELRCIFLHRILQCFHYVFLVEKENILTQECILSGCSCLIDILFIAFESMNSSVSRMTDLPSVYLILEMRKFMKSIIGIFLCTSVKNLGRSAYLLKRIVELNNYIDKRILEYDTEYFLSSIGDKIKYYRKKRSLKYLVKYASQDYKVDLDKSVIEIAKYRFSCVYRFSCEVIEAMSLDRKPEDNHNYEEKVDRAIMSLIDSDTSLNTLTKNNSGVGTNIIQGRKTRDELRKRKDEILFKASPAICFFHTSDLVFGGKTNIFVNDKYHHLFSSVLVDLLLKIWISHSNLYENGEDMKTVIVDNNNNNKNNNKKKKKKKTTTKDMNEIRSNIKISSLLLLGKMISETILKIKKTKNSSFFLKFPDDYFRENKKVKMLFSVIGETPRNCLVTILNSFLGNENFHVEENLDLLFKNEIKYFPKRKTPSCANEYFDLIKRLYECIIIKEIMKENEEKIVSVNQLVLTNLLLWIDNPFFNIFLQREEKNLSPFILSFFQNSERVMDNVHNRVEKSDCLKVMEKLFEVMIEFGKTNYQFSFFVSKILFSMFNTLEDQEEMIKKFIDEYTIEKTIILSNPFANNNNKGDENYNYNNSINFDSTIGSSSHGRTHDNNSSKIRKSRRRRRERNTNLNYFGTNDRPLKLEEVEERTLKSRNHQEEEGMDFHIHELSIVSIEMLTLFYSVGVSNEELKDNDDIGIDHAFEKNLMFLLYVNKTKNSRHHESFKNFLFTIIDKKYQLFGLEHLESYIEESKTFKMLFWDKNSEDDGFLEDEVIAKLEDCGVKNPREKLQRVRNEHNNNISNENLGFLDTTTTRDRDVGLAGDNFGNGISFSFSASGRNDNDDSFESFSFGGDGNEQSTSNNGWNWESSGDSYQIGSYFTSSSSSTGENQLTENREEKEEEEEEEEEEEKKVFVFN